MNNNKIIDAFDFSFAPNYMRAEKEKKNIERIKEKLDFNDVAAVQKMYEKIIEKRYFVTPVGIAFLEQLRAFIIEKTGNEKVAYIPVPVSKAERENEALRESIKEKEDIIIKLKQLKRKLIVAVVALIICVVAMIFMVVSNDNLGYVNTENKILNKYSAWEEELDAREKALEERENGINSGEKYNNTKE